jgi:hypothetical protein
MEATISSIEGSDGDFSAGMEAPDNVYVSWAELRGIASATVLGVLLRKSAAEADPLILHLLVMALHIVKLHGQF